MAIILDVLKWLWKLLADYPFLWIVVVVVAALLLGRLITFVQGTWAGLRALHRGMKRLTVWARGVVRWCREMKGLPTKVDLLTVEVAILKDLVAKPSKEEPHEPEEEDFPF